MQRIGRQRRQRRFVAEKAVDGVFDDGQAEFLDDAHQVGAPRRRHRHAQRILNRRLDVQRRQMRLAMGLLNRVRTNAVFVHRQRHQRDAEAGGNVLDEGIGQRLDAATAAARHHRGQRRGDALPAVGGEDELVGARGPVPAGEKFGRNGSRRLRADDAGLPERDIERFGPLQPFERSCDHRRLRRQQRIVDFEVDALAARFGQRGNAAARFAGHEGAASDFADDEPAAQQLGVDAARGRDRDLALIGEAALRRQPVAGLERAAGDFDGDGIGKLQIFEL